MDVNGLDVFGCTKFGCIWMQMDVLLLFALLDAKKNRQNSAVGFFTHPVENFLLYRLHPKKYCGVLPVVEENGCIMKKSALTSKNDWENGCNILFFDIQISMFCMHMVSI